MLLAAGMIAGLAVAGAWVALNSVGGAAVAAGLGPAATVTRGPLVYSVTESGDVEAERRRVIGNELRYPVEWLKRGTDVSSLTGQPVQLVVRMRGASLYSLQFTP